MSLEIDNIVLDADGSQNQRKHIMLYKFASSFVGQSSNVLDVACGSGYGSEYLSRLASNGRVEGVDISKDSIRFAEKNYNNENLGFKHASVTNLPYENELFDIVVSFETIEHLDNTLGYLSELFRVLKTDGIFICSTPIKGCSKKPPFHVHEFTEEEFFGVIRLFFKDIRRFYQYLPTYIWTLDRLKIKARFPVIFSLGKKILFRQVISENQIKAKRIDQSEVYFPYKITRKGKKLLAKKSNSIVVCKK